MIIDLEMIEWKRKVISLHEAEYKLEKYSKEGKISSRERKKIKKIIDQLWIKNWDFYPDKNPLIEQCFKLNFT